MITHFGENFNCMRELFWGNYLHFGHIPLKSVKREFFENSETKDCFLDQINF